MSEITINSNILKKKINIKNALNLKVMKCYKNAFSTKGLKVNIGSYIILSFIFFVSIFLVLFLKKGFSVVKGYINLVNSCKNPNDNIITQRTEQQSEGNLGLNDIINKKGKKKKGNKNKMKNININLLNQNIIINNEQEVKTNNKKKNRSKRNKVEPPRKKVRKINKLNNNNISNIKTSGEETSKGKTSFVELNNNEKDKIIKLNVEPLKDTTKKQTQNNNNKNNKNTKTKYNDYELNNLNYKQAIITDKRSYLFLSLSEKNILEFKNKNSKNETIQDLINKLIIKFILFFVFIYILLILFWYYLVCFCAVYINTQIHLLKDTFISYTLYLVYPFGLCLLPGIFRIGIKRLIILFYFLMIQQCTKYTKTMETLTLYINCLK